MSEEEKQKMLCVVIEFSCTEWARVVILCRNTAVLGTRKKQNSQLHGPLYFEF